jgi:hypothetical protein
VVAKVPNPTLKLPFRDRKFKNLKDALRHGVYSRPNGKSAETLAMESGLDRLSDLSRYVGDNPDDSRGKFLDIFIPLLVAMGEKGVEVWEYIGEEIRAAQGQDREDDIAVAARFIKDQGPAFMEAMRIMAGQKR